MYICIYMYMYIYIYIYIYSMIMISYYTTGSPRRGRARQGARGAGRALRLPAERHRRSGPDLVKV